MDSGVTLSPILEPPTDLNSHLSTPAPPSLSYVHLPTVPPHSVAPELNLPTSHQLSKLKQPYCH